MDTLSGVMKLKDRMTPALKKVSKTITTVSAKILRAQNKINNVSQQTLGNIATKTTKVNAKVNSAVNKAHGATASKLTRKSKSVIKDLQLMTKAIEKQTLALSRQTSVVNKLIRENQRLRRIEKQRAAEARASSKFKKGASKVGSSLQGLAMGSLPLTYGLYKSIEEYARFEHQMQKVIAKSNPALVDKAMRGDYIAKAQHLGRTTQFTQTEVAEGMEQLTIAGLQGKDLLNAIDPAVFMAGANPELGMEGSTRMISTVAKAFADQIDMTSIKDLTKVSDTISYLASNFKGTAADFEEGFKYTIASARQMGLSWEDTLLNVAALHEVGSIQSMAGTSFNQMLTNLAAPTKKGQEALDTLKIKQYDEEGKPKNIFEIFREFREKSAMYTPEARNKLFKDMFGIRGGRSVAGSIGLIDKVFDKLADTSKGLNEGTLQAGYAEKMTKDQLDSLIGQLTLAKSLMNDIQTTMVDLLFNDFGQSPGLSALKKMVEYGQNFAAIFADISKHVREGTTPLWAAALAVAKIYRNTGQMDPVMKNIAAAALGFYEGLELAYNIAKKIFLAVMDALGQNGFDDIRKNVKMITAALIGLAVAAPIIIGLGVALFALTNIFGAISGAFTMLSSGAMLLPVVFTKVVGVFKIIGKLLLMIIRNPITMLKTLGRVLLGSFASIGSVLSTLFTTVLPIILGVIAVLDLFRGENESFIDAFFNMVGAIGAVFSAIWDKAIMPLLSGIWEVLAPAIDVMIVQWGLLKEEIRALFSGDGADGSTLKWLGDMFVTIFSFLGRAVAWSSAFVIDVVSGFFSHIRRIIRVFRELFSGEGNLFIRIARAVFTVILSMVGTVVDVILSRIQGLLDLLGKEEWAASVGDARAGLTDRLDRMAGFSEEELAAKNAKLMGETGDNGASAEFDKLVNSGVSFLDSADGVEGLLKAMNEKLGNIAGSSEETAGNTKKKTKLNIDGRNADRRQADRQDILRERAGARKDPIARRFAAAQGYHG